MMMRVLCVVMMGLLLSCAKPQAIPNSVKEGEVMSTKFNDLTVAEKNVIEEKGTERPFTGEYNDHYLAGTYICRKCNAVLYRSEDKFKSGCGWPSFDDEVAGAVRKETDSDGRRTEILCANCDGHLGHVFYGEKLTEKDTRHCVNSLSMKFIEKGKDLPKPIVQKKARAIFASGCFWGTEYHLQKVKGVLGTTCGYIGGSKDKPTYKEVCSGATGHAEAVEVLYDPDVVSYEVLAKIFFETHDPGQLNRQGPDVGTQYRSEIFYFDQEQKETAEELIKQLQAKGYLVVTKLTKVSEFFDAEGYHQDYYDRQGSTPYCHAYQKKF